MSESDEHVTLPKPVFKKKTGRGSCRRQRASTLDLESTSSFAVARRETTPPPSKWEKYRALGKTSPAPGDTSVKYGPETAESEPVGAGENTAYTTLHIAPTFTLETAHFRDAGVSLEREYADAFGNVSDDEGRGNGTPAGGPATFVQDDYSQDEDDVGLPAGMYDSELSLDEAGDTRRPRLPDHEAVSASVAKKIAVLEASTAHKHARMQAVDSRLRSLEAEWQAAQSSL